MINKKFKVSTSWVNTNAFFVLVEEYKRVPRFIFRDKWIKVKTFEHASWETFMEKMWLSHMLHGKSLWEIDTKI